MFRQKAVVVGDPGCQLNWELLRDWNPQANSFTTATRPTGVQAGTIIFVSDAVAGSKFQGWDGASWVSLG